MKAAWVLFLAMAAAAALAWGRPVWVAFALAAAGVVLVVAVSGPRLRARLLPLLLITGSLAAAMLLGQFAGGLP